MILDEMKIPYTKDGEDTYILEDVGGQITDDGDYLYIYYSTTAVKIRKDDPELRPYIEAYMEGADEFMAFVYNREHKKS